MDSVYRIASSEKIGGNFFTVGKKSKVTEKIFWDIVEKNVKYITRNQPNKFSETLELVKSHLMKKEALTIGDTWFKISNR